MPALFKYKYNITIHKDNTHKLRCELSRYVGQDLYWVHSKTNKKTGIKVYKIFMEEIEATVLTLATTCATISKSDNRKYYNIDG
jgi:hypothetical protein